MVIENLVFEGGGTKGAAFAGGIQVIDDLGLFAKVKRVAGTSAGSITATLLACGAGSAGLTESVHHTDFREFIYDKGWVLDDIFRTVQHYGMHTGNTFVSILKEYIERYAGDGELTFAQLDRLVADKPETYKQLSVVASNLTRQKPQIFNSELTPDLPIWRAVRASICIPLIFEPIKINGDFYVDGGLSWIFPINIYDTTLLNRSDGDEFYERNPATLGFYLEPHVLVPGGPDYDPPEVKIDSLRTFAIAMASFLMDNANSKNLHPDDRSRTIFIDDLGVSGTDFNTSKEMIDKLVESGCKATQAYFSRQG
jgi:NTE family protein